MDKLRKFYFIDLDSPHSSHFEEGWCYTKESILETMEDEEIEELKAYRAVRDTNSDAFYCNDIGEVFLKGDSPCGKSCTEYKPRNGSNGICKHHRGVWMVTNEVVLFKRNAVTANCALGLPTGKEASNA